MTTVPRSEATSVASLAAQLHPDDLESVVLRLRRAQGQLGGVLRMLEEGRGCTEVVTQLAAAHSAVGRAGFEVIALGMAVFLSAPDDHGAPDLAELRRLFLTFA